ncbi:MAG: PEGA domain-containing protein [Deltaproteobacteria bacterium]|nr:PEGA domain-containing protein [Deltaproteobacteria bacterium]
MKRTSLLSVLAAVAVLLISAGVASADRVDRVDRVDHEVGVVVTGEATIQPQLAHQLELWMTKTGHKLVATPLAPDAVNAIIDCFVIEDEPCARQVFDKRSKTGTIVYARADVQAGSTAMERDVALTAYWFDRSANTLVSKKKRCERCNEDKLRAAADELANELAATAGKVGHLKCKSDPVGADVSVGNRKIGVTPLEQPLAPGTYKVVVGQESRDVTVVAGQTVDVDISLPFRGGGRGGGKRSRTPAIGVMAAGVALLATGVVLFAMDEDIKESGPQPRTFNDTAPLGVGLAITGVVVTGVGAYLYGKKPSRRSSPVGAVTPNGGFVGWAGRF